MYSMPLQTKPPRVLEDVHPLAPVPVLERQSDAFFASGLTHEARAGTAPRAADLSLRMRQSGRIMHLREDLLLMAMQTREAREQSDQMLESASLNQHVQRDLLHLEARLEGMQWQLEDLIQTIDRALYGPHCRRRDEASGLTAP